MEAAPSLSLKTYLNRLYNPASSAKNITISDIESTIFSRPKHDCQKYSLHLSVNKENSFHSTKYQSPELLHTCPSVLYKPSEKNLKPFPGKCSWHHLERLPCKHNLNNQKKSSTSNKWYTELIKKYKYQNAHQIREQSKLIVQSRSQKNKQYSRPIAESGFRSLKPNFTRKTISFQQTQNKYYTGKLLRQNNTLKHISMDVTKQSSYLGETVDCTPDNHSNSIVSVLRKSSHKKKSTYHQSSPSTLQQQQQQQPTAKSQEIRGSFQKAVEKTTAKIIQEKISEQSTYQNRIVTEPEVSRKTSAHESKRIEQSSEEIEGWNQPSQILSEITDQEDDEVEELGGPLASILENPLQDYFEKQVTDEEIQRVATSHSKQIKKVMDHIIFNHFQKHYERTQVAKKLFVASEVLEKPCDMFRKVLKVMNMQPKPSSKKINMVNQKLEVMNHMLDKIIGSVAIKKQIHTRSRKKTEFSLATEGNNEINNSGVASTSSRKTGVFNGSSAHQYKASFMQRNRQSRNTNFDPVRLDPNVIRSYKKKTVKMSMNESSDPNINEQMYRDKKQNSGKHGTNTEEDNPIPLLKRHVSSLIPNDSSISLHRINTDDQKQQIEEERSESSEDVQDKNCLLIPPVSEESLEEQRRFVRQIRQIMDISEQDDEPKRKRHPTRRSNTQNFEFTKALEDENTVDMSPSVWKLYEDQFAAQVQRLAELKQLQKQQQKTILQKDMPTSSILISEAIKNRSRILQEMRKKTLFKRVGAGQQNEQHLKNILRKTKKTLPELFQAMLGQNH